MPLTSSERRALAARGHALTPSATLAEKDVGEGAAEHVRRLFESAELIKVRVNTRDRNVFAMVIDQLAERVPCTVVQRIGRVALLYKPGAEAGDADAGLE